MTRVLPEPGPAIMRIGPSTVCTASRWAGFKPSRISIWPIIAFCCLGPSNSSSGGHLATHPPDPLPLIREGGEKRDSGGHPQAPGRGGDLLAPPHTRMDLPGREGEPPA